MFYKNDARRAHKITLLAITLIGSAFFAASAQAQDASSAQTTLSAQDVARLLGKIEALENRVAALEAEKKSLEEKQEFATERLERVENRAARAVQPGVAPTFGDVGGNFSFRLRGVINVDAVAFDARKGGFNFNNGTAFRRARLGFEGTFFRDFQYRVESDFAGNQVTLLDAYVSYTGIRPFTFTLGQHKAPFGLESNNSDSFNTFIERGAFTNAFGAVGAERRIGISAAYARGNFNAALGFFGDGEGQNRANAGPDESYGFNGRATYALRNEPGEILHIGASGYYRTSLKSVVNATTGQTADAVRVTERPNIRVDGTNIIDSGTILNVNSVSYLGAEAVGVLGPITFAGEYGRLFINRSGTLQTVEFDGFYAYATYFLTGEVRTLRNGNFDRIRPFNDFNLAEGKWGAFEVALRFDKLNVDRTPILARRGNNAQSFTTALNWYFNPNLKVQFNWVRFKGTNTPLDPIGNEAAGDAYATRLHLDF